MPTEPIRETREICRIAQHIVSDSVAPAVSICVAQNRSDGWLRWYGTAGTLSTHDCVPVSPHTPFDLASLTKPFVALTAATLACESNLRLSAPIADWFPEFASSPLRLSTLERLLSHRAGLRPHISLFGRNQRRQAVNESEALHLIACQGALKEQTAGNKPPRSVYSDLGYIVVGTLLERYFHVDLDELVGTILCSKLKAPIGSSRQWRAAIPRFPTLVAPTEHVGWRGGLLRGQVHDENAWALAGHGLAGHAGLFGTAAGIAELGCAVVDSLAGRDSVLNPFAAHFCTGTRPGGTHRAGFDGKSLVNSSAGTQLGPESFGHLGFTGTSLWCDPAQGLVIALLTNRVCPSRNNARLVGARGFFHDCLVKAANTLA